MKPQKFSKKNRSVRRKSQKGGKRQNKKKTYRNKGKKMIMRGGAHVDATTGGVEIVGDKMYIEFGTYNEESPKLFDLEMGVSQEVDLPAERLEEGRYYNAVIQAVESGSEWELTWKGKHYKLKFENTDRKIKPNYKFVFTIISQEEVPPTSAAAAAT